MTRRNPLETAKAILEGNKTDAMDARMVAMIDLMSKELETRGDTEDEIAEATERMQTMSYEEMVEALEEEGILIDSEVEEDDSDLEEEGVPAKADIKKKKEEDEPEVDKVKTDKPDSSRADAESDLETLKGAKKAKKVEPKGNQGNVKEDLEKLFSGEELSEDFKTKATVVFETAINLKTKSLQEELKAEYDALLEESKEEFRTELSEKVDEYLSYVVEEWAKDNELAIERGIRGDIAESFMTGLKDLFENHYITVPDDKYDLLEGLYEKIGTLEEELNGQMKKNSELNKDAMISRCLNVFNDVTEELTDTQVEKMQSLAEGLEYESEEQFREKLTVLREHHFTDTGTDSSDLISGIAGDPIVEDTDTDSTNDDTAYPEMALYEKVLSRSAHIQRQTNTGS